MIHLTRADIEWVKKLIMITSWIHQEYPELFNDEEEETLLIVDEILRNL